MTKPTSPFEADPPSAAQLIRSIAFAIAGAVLVLVTLVLPAEYSIDPTGIGGALGLTAMNESTRTIQIKDVIGGNERYREIKVPDLRDPIPLPNPAVFQNKSTPPRSQIVKLKLKPGQETEVKAVLETSQVMLYSWQATGAVYVDFHGHESGTGSEAFVRYEEQQSGTRGDGSLVAPFTGEHGWFWLNISDQEVEVTVTFSGYYKDFVDYGISGS